ncbi:LysM peptidoglycan-binding domain-containing protein [Bacillus sp. A116_S68]|nr:LysM peptidoglycan-binding domain-containing protein [Bacillus sp. A116_S68]
MTFRHELRALNAEASHYALIIHLDGQLTEFAKELGSTPEVRQDFMVSVRQLAKNKYPSLKVTIVKVMVGGLLFSSIPLFDNKPVSAATTQSVETGSIYYRVKQDDTLWLISRAYNISVDTIKRANGLKSDAIEPNQRLILPQAFHTVQAGESLSVVARDYKITADAIRQANKLSGDHIRTGQSLIIPIIISTTVPETSPVPEKEPSATPTANGGAQQSTYTVVSGDSLSLIAKRFGITTEALRTANHLTSDSIRIGQTLTIPGQNHTPSSPQAQIIDSIYTVVSGDSVSVIAKRFGTTTEALRSANNLTSDVLQVGQRLVIPGSTSSVPPSSGGTGTTYTVVSGDSLSVIAKRFGTTTEALRSANNLTSDVLQVGQRLVIPGTTSSAPPPSGSTGTTYTVVSGDSLSVIAQRFGTTTEALRSANNLTSDVLQVGQHIVIPGTTSPAPPPSGGTGTTYTVVSGDCLSVIAKRFGTTTEALRIANNLTSDVLQVGQSLVIPGATSPAPPPSGGTGTTYTVVSGDSLSVIAKRFGTTTETLRSANNLTSDVLQVGQSLVIPGATSPAPPPSGGTGTTYTVVSGDSLSVIAKRFGTTTEALRSVNNLTSDVLRIGQVLTVPNGQMTPPPTEERMTFTYRVVSGDTLSSIATRFGVTVTAIRSANHLTSDMLQVGQALTIPDGKNVPNQTGVNTITYTTHTVVSGDNIWNLSVQYGIPQTELLRTNNLTTNSSLSIGQKLTIPVHHIGVKEVVSARHGEFLDWFTEAQYVFPIGKTATVTDFETGRSFKIKRTVGSGHADSETLTVTDTNIAKSIWGGFSWTPRAVIVEVDGRRLAASMDFMPHDVQFITNNGINGHFDVYFSNSIRHVDGRPNAQHQAQVERAAGLR